MLGINIQFLTFPILTNLLTVPVVRSIINISYIMFITHLAECVDIYTCTPMCLCCYHCIMWSPTYIMWLLVIISSLVLCQLFINSEKFICDITLPPPPTFHSHVLVFIHQGNKMNKFKYVYLKVFDVGFILEQLLIWTLLFYLFKYFPSFSACLQWPGIFFDGITEIFWRILQGPIHAQINCPSENTRSSHSAKLFSQCYDQSASTILHIILPTIFDTIYMGVSWKPP